MDIYGRRVSPTRELINPIRNKTAQIDRMLIDPSYSDRRFNGSNSRAHTIYLATELEISVKSFGEESVSGLFYVYDDRLMQHHGYERTINAGKEAKKQIGNNQSADYFEQMLMNLMNDETIMLGHILSGVNVATQYSYRVFGYSTSK